MSGLENSKRCGGVGVVESQEGLWRRVWALVMRWLRWRTSSHHDAEDLAADDLRR